MTKLDSLLDGLHAVSTTVAKATARKRRINRDQVRAIMNIAAHLAGAIGLVVPQARPAALVLSGLQEAVPQALIPENPLFSKLRAVNNEINQTTGEQRMRLEAQRDLLLRLIEEQEHNR
jgi:hypothetical protein